MLPGLVFKAYLAIVLKYLALFIYFLYILYYYQILNRIIPVFSDLLLIELNYLKFHKIVQFFVQRAQ